MVHEHDDHVIVAGHGHGAEQRGASRRVLVPFAVGLHQLAVLEVTERGDGDGQPHAVTVHRAGPSVAAAPAAAAAAADVGLQRPFDAAQRVPDPPQPVAVHGRQQRADHADDVRRQRVQMADRVLGEHQRPHLVRRQEQLRHDRREQERDVTVHAGGRIGSTGTRRASGRRECDGVAIRERRIVKQKRNKEKKKKTDPVASSSRTAKSVGPPELGLPPRARGRGIAV